MASFSKRGLILPGSCEWGYSWHRVVLRFSHGGIAHLRYGRSINYKWTCYVLCSMPREGKTAITVDKETFDRLKEDKPEGVTWDRFLKSAVNTWDSARDW